MDDLISVVIPVYNVQDYIDRCLNSVVNQTYKNLEIIVIDDGSTDLSGKKCDEWAKNDKRIKVIHQENKGIAETRNIGVSKSFGKYISFVDSDDYIDNEMIGTLYKILIKTNSKISTCGFKRVSDERKIGLKHSSEVNEYSTKNALISLLKEEDITVHLCNKIFLKDLFIRNKMPKEYSF